jgi:hypothetical protein
MRPTKSRNRDPEESEVFDVPGSRRDEYPWFVDQRTDSHSPGEFAISVTVCSIETGVGSARSKYSNADRH